MPDHQLAEPVSPAGPVTFDPLEEGFVEWPYDQYRRLRQHDPIHRSTRLHAYCLTRYDDVNRILRDPTVSADIGNADPTPLTTDELRRRDEGSRGWRTLVLLDDPDHAMVRKLLIPPFRAREVESLRSLVEERVARRLDQLVERADGGVLELDLIEDFAYPLPVEMFCEMLGVPEEDHPIFRFWVNCIARVIDPVVETDERNSLMGHMAEMFLYLDSMVAAKRDDPGDDILTQLIQAEEDGDTLTHEELMAQIMTLYVAGHEPTAGLVGNGMRALLTHPDQMEMLRADRSLLRNGVSELLRYEGPNQFVRRVSTTDMDFDTPEGVVTIPARSVIYASPASANHDETRWGPTVDQVDITRADASQHLQLGAGIHACLGTHLARLQAETMFSALLDRFSSIELAGDPEWTPRMVIRSLRHLPVRAHVA